MSHSKVNGACLVVVEYHFTEKGRRCIVHVKDNILGTLDGLKCAADEFFSRWRKNLDVYVIRNQTILYNTAHKAKVCITGRGKCHFDFLKTTFDQGLEEDDLLLFVHGASQGLVTIAQVHRRPNRRCALNLTWPLPIRQMYWGVWLVLGARIHDVKRVQARPHAKPTKSYVPLCRL